MNSQIINNSIEAVPANAYGCTFYFKYKDRLGTIFTYNQEGKQYFITAKHITHDINEKDTVQILTSTEGWKKFNSKLIGNSPKTDISVLALHDFINNTQTLKPAQLGDLIVSQNVFFLGFPLNLINFDLTKGKKSLITQPFVKKGILSNIMNYSDYSLLFIDAINNQGFSGGPILAWNYKINEMCVLGIISGFIMEKNKGKINSGSSIIEEEFLANSGLMIGYHIQDVINIISKNPNGRIIKTK